MAESVRVIDVRENGEWGTFIVRTGVSRPDHGGDERHWCELTCNTAFGCVGYHWGSMGGPATWFLGKIGKDYLLGKLWGERRSVFDGDTALEQLRKLILDQRQNGGALTREQARERWDELKGQSWSSEIEFVRFVDDCDWLYRHLCDCGGPFGRAPNPQAEGFYRDLWPGFIRQLQQPDPAASSVHERAYRIANQFDANRKGLPEEWQDWAEEIARDLRNLVEVERPFQSRVATWMDRCFDRAMYSNMTERGDRLLEEVLELLQATGYDCSRVATLVDYTFGRPPGEPAQEVGGVMVTLAGFCSVAGLDMHADGERELARISEPAVMAKIRSKQDAKNALHFDTPLPGTAGAGQGCSA